MIEAPVVRCSRCHTPLKLETVRVPVPKDQLDLVPGHPGYETRQEYSDCPRCHGSY